MNLIGHQKQKQYFNRVIANNSLSHAYLFRGRRGIGKSSFALSLAESVLGASEDSVAMVRAHSHPDLFVLASDELLGVKEIAPLYDFLSQKALIASVKVAIIDNAELLTPEAQNKLLKVTEESDNTLFIFVADMGFKILPALKSRLFVINFSPLSEAELKELILIKNLALDESLFDYANGSIDEYKKLLTDEYRVAIERLNKLLFDLFNEGKLGDLSILELFKKDTRVFFYYLHKISLLAFKNGNLKIEQLDKINSMINQTQSALLRGQNYNLLSESLIFKIEEEKCSQ